MTWRSPWSPCPTASKHPTKRTPRGGPALAGDENSWVGGDVQARQVHTTARRCIFRPHEARVTGGEVNERAWPVSEAATHTEKSTSREGWRMSALFLSLPPFISLSLRLLSIFLSIYLSLCFVHVFCGVRHVAALTVKRRRWRRPCACVARVWSPDKAP